MQAERPGKTGLVVDLLEEPEEAGVDVVQAGRGQRRSDESLGEPDWPPDIVFREGEIHTLEINKSKLHMTGEC